MAEPILTVLDLRARCLAGDGEAWRSFIRIYGSLARHLVKHYFRRESEPELLQEVFAATRGEAGPFWKAFGGMGQKEFLLHVRRHVLEVGRKRRGPAPETALTPELFSALMKHFRPAQQEILILTLKGYGAEDVSTVTRSFKATAQRIVREALYKLPDVLGAPVGEDFFGRDHDALFAQIDQERSEQCLPDRFYVLFEDGGALSWRDRDNAERHFETCRRCLVRLTDYRETHHFFRTLPPLENETVAALALHIGFPIETEPGKKPLWRRFWS